MGNKNQIDARDDSVLDRLVDGELSDAQEREVIAQLSQMPDGWRRCAVAFLEARCWQRAAERVQELSREGRVKAPHTTQSPGWRSAGSVSGRWPFALALCALFLLAVGVGTLLPKPSSRTATPPAPSAGAPGNTQLVNQSGPAPSVGSPSLKTAPDSQNLLLGNVTLVDNSGRAIELPVYDWNQQVAEQLMYGSEPLPLEFVEQLKRHQVRSHRSYFPVKLQDGRQVVVPIEKLEIIPVGGTAY